MNLNKARSTVRVDKHSSYMVHSQKRVCQGDVLSYTSCPEVQKTISAGTETDTLLVDAEFIIFLNNNT